GGRVATRHLPYRVGRTPRQASGLGGAHALLEQRWPCRTPDEIRRPVCDHVESICDRKFGSLGGILRKSQYLVGKQGTRSPKGPSARTRTLRSAILKNLGGP